MLPWPLLSMLALQQLLEPCVDASSSTVMGVCVSMPCLLVETVFSEISAVCHRIQVAQLQNSELSFGCFLLL